ncbi:MAG: PQQ-binding-like beta-propeller repeat protein [Phycisphaerae bacterium]|nr:PQQ-binding-like beta-propeller repeat protein [Phycisphaerae bacterium]
MKRHLVCFWIGLAVATAGGVAQGQPQEWPYWRGPEQNGSTRETAVVTSWSTDGENLLWKVPYGGRSTPIVMHGRVFLIGPVGEGENLQERIFCLDAATGELIWERRFNVFHTDIVENRVGWTSLVGDYSTGYVYAHLTGGELVCLNAEGEVKWKHSLTEEYGRVSGYGGRLMNPVLDQDLVIVSFLSSGWGDQAKPLHRYFAFHRRTGELRWVSSHGEQPLDTTYATPVVSVIQGLRTLVAPGADGRVYGLKARTSEPLWWFNLSKRGLNASAVVEGNYVYVSHSEENIDNSVMGRVVCINGVLRGDITTSGEIWRQDGIEAGYASPAYANGRLYVVDNQANLHCLDGQTGKKHWEFSLGRVGKGSPVVTADGVIYVGEQNGVFHILKDQGETCVSLDREEFSGPGGAIDEIFGSPAVAGGRVYFMTRYNTYCLGKPDLRMPEVQIPPMPQERVAQRRTVSDPVVWPTDVTLKPGSQEEYAAWQYSGDTIHLTRPKVTWDLEGVEGTISRDGTLKIKPDAGFSAGYVVARTATKLEAKARVRVIPDPPFTIDFESMKVGSAPPGWIAASRRVEVVERDGSKVLRKLASKERPSPPFMRLQTYFTLPIEGGYTVIADVLGTEKENKVMKFLPDMGIINSRYTMSLLGGDQALRIESWSAVPRIRKDVPFRWEAEKWYRMKFQVALKGDKAILRGKVWPRDSAEPEAWTMELEDSTPNREGSVGLSAYSNGTTPKSDGTEVYFDNIQVIPNGMKK